MRSAVNGLSDAWDAGAEVGADQSPDAGREERARLIAQLIHPELGCSADDVQSSLDQTGYSDDYRPSYYLDWRSSNVEEFDPGELSGKAFRMDVKIALHHFEPADPVTMDFYLVNGRAYLGFDVGCYPDI
jgi:hypothetical protein